jgi:hypothetical protein
MWRRIAAENLSQGTFYHLVDLGCVPVERTAIVDLQKQLKEEDGLVGLACEDETQTFPTGVRAIKGIVRSGSPQFRKNYACICTFVTGGRASRVLGSHAQWGLSEMMTFSAADGDARTPAVNTDSSRTGSVNVLTQ